MADGKTKTAADRRLISGTQRYEVNLRGKAGRIPVDAALRLQSFRPSTAESAVGAGLQISVDVVDVGSEIGIASEPFHDRVPAAALAPENDTPECVDVDRSGDERGREGRADSIGAVAMIAAGMIAPVTIIGPSIGLAVGDPVELVGGSKLLRTLGAGSGAISDYGE